MKLTLREKLRQKIQTLVPVTDLPMEVNRGCWQCGVDIYRWFVTFADGQEAFSIYSMTECVNDGELEFYRSICSSMPLEIQPKNPKRPRITA